MSAYLNVYDLIEGYSQNLYKIISFYDDYNLVCQKSYSDIHSDVVLMAQKLSSQLGKNEIFFVSLPNSYEFLIVFLGSLKAGVIPAPIASPDSMTRSEYFNFLREFKSGTQTHKILAPDVYRSEMVKEGFEFVSMNEAPPSSEQDKFINNPQKPKFLPAHLKDQIAFIQYSSGSTAEPKGVLISHTALIENITQIKESFELSSRSILVSWLPFFHDMGLIGGLLTPLLAPFPVHILNPTDFEKSPRRFLELTTKLKATIWVGPDSMYRTLTKTIIQSPFEQKIDLSSLQVCICGSEPVLIETFNQFSQVAIPLGWNPISFVPAYGQAENVLLTTFAPLRTRIKTYEKNKRLIVSCGKPVGKLKIQILDEKQKLLKDGLEGLIWIQSTSLCTGYLDNDEKFKSRRLGAWFFTGDIGFIKDEQLFISGRFKDLIIVDSKKYFLIDLEQRIWNVIGHNKHVKKVAVVRKSSIGGDETISVFIEWLDFFPLGSIRQRLAFTSKIIHSFKNQIKISKKDIHFTGIRSLDRTTSGKLKRYSIRRRLKRIQIKSTLWSIFWRSWYFGFTR